jgi:hypothetical protein
LAYGTPVTHGLPFHRDRLHRRQQSRGPALLSPPTSFEKPGIGRSRFWRFTSLIHVRSAGYAIALQPVTSRIAFTDRYGPGASG